METPSQISTSWEETVSISRHITHARMFVLLQYIVTELLRDIILVVTYYLVAKLPRGCNRISRELEVG